MNDIWMWWIIGIGLASIALLTALWLWRGVWLALHKGSWTARMRWRLYSRTTRWAKKTFRIQYAQAALRMSNPMHSALEMPKSSHGQRIKVERRRRRGQVAK